MTMPAAPVSYPSGEQVGSAPELVTRRRIPMSRRVPMVVSRACWYLLCSLLGVTMLVPLLWMVSIALKPDSNILQLPPQLLPFMFFGTKLPTFL